MRTKTYLILWTAVAVSVLLLVVLAGCAPSDKQDSVMETSVAGNISAQSNSEQNLPAADDPIETSMYCPECQIVRVNRVIDGDTIDTSIGRLRFFGVDTPEKGEKCFTEATEFTRRLVGTQVRLEYGPRLEDTYGRRLAYVFEGSGESIDAQLIAGGLATAWTRDGQYKDVLLGIEQAAIANGRGCLWSDSQDESDQYDYVGITNQLIKFDSEWRALTTFSQGLEGGTPYAYFSGLILQSFDFDHIREKLNVIKFDLARTNVPDDLIPIKNELSEIYEIEINAFGFGTGEWNADVTPSNVVEVISVIEAGGQASGPLEGLTRRLYDNQWTEAQLMRKKLYEYWMTEMLDKGLGRDFVDAFATDLDELGAITTFGD